LRMQRAINETRIEGIYTNLPFHRIALAEEDFINGRYTTEFIEKHNIVKKARELAKKEKEKL
jgi:pyruvate carboxylase